ncbi:MAG: YbaB/EbfC family nucleoid-associated protein [Bacillota bacterium]|nr:YbaB/EbfC family nucleoid-associated protein [Bacillota bacterium]
MGKGMKAGKKPHAPKQDMQARMAQVQALQNRMGEVQAQIDATETEASAGGGAVTVKVNGKHQLTSVVIDKEVLDDVEMLQDLIIAASNEAMRQIDEIAETEMGKVTGGLNLGF